jgi:hypothetical protein
MEHLVALAASSVLFHEGVNRLHIAHVRDRMS